MSIKLIRTPEQIDQQLIQAWDRLTKSAIEPNVFYESWCLIPALQNLKGDQDVFIVTIWADSQESSCSEELIGLFPLCLQPTYARLAIPCLALWKHQHCFLCTPLIKTAHAQDCLSQLLKWFDTNRSNPRILRFRDINGSGSFLSELLAKINIDQRPFDQSCYARALLESKLAPQTYLRSSLSRKSRAEFMRQRRRLAELGKLEVRHLNQSDDPQRWLVALLNLEKRGWKGEAGSAIACNSNEIRFFELIVQAAFERQQLLMSALLLDGVEIAVRCSFSANQGAFAIKTAYDQRFSKYSPGVQLELAVTEAVLANQNISWMDSCAAPDQRLFNQLWSEKRILYHITVGKRDCFSSSMIRAITTTRKLLRR